MEAIGAFREKILKTFAAVANGDPEATAQVAMAMLVIGLTIAAVVWFSGNDGGRLVRVGKETDFAPGTMKAVPVPGGSKSERVLVVRTATGRFSAFPPYCTHYKVPLEKGVVSGDRIVCPAHAACFNAETGDIEDGAGVDGLPRFPVDVSGGEVRVRLPDGKMPVRKEVSCPHGPPVSSGAGVVLVGGGPATLAAAETLRSDGYKGKIVMLCREAMPLYDRVKVTKNLAATPAQIALRHVPEWSRKMHVEVLTGVEVTGVDAASKRIQYRATGADADADADDALTTLPYEHALVATGGDAISFRADRPCPFPPIPGADLARIFTMRNAGDNTAVMAELRALQGRNGGRGPHVLLLGSSFIGLETAAALAQECALPGADADADQLKLASLGVVGMEEEPFERVFGKDIGRAVRQLHEEKGVTFFMESVIQRFLPEAGDGAGVGGADVAKRGGGGATTVPADLVIIGAGVSPCIDLLSGNDGIEVDGRRGVAVDGQMRVRGADGLFAAGDIAEFPYAHSAHASTDRVRIEHWDVALDQGRTAARAMMGSKAVYEGVPFFWTQQFTWNLRYSGHARATDRVVVQGSLSGRKPRATVFFCADGKVCAVGTLNNDPQAVAAMELIRRGRMPPVVEIATGDMFDLAKYLRESDRP